MPTKPIERLAMKDGIFSPTCTSPLIRPNRAPTISAPAIASHPHPARLPPNAVNIVANSTAQTATAPSMERSIDPMRMTKVTPMPIISDGVDRMEMRAKLRMERKFGLATEKNTTSANSTRSGAHFCRLSLVKILSTLFSRGERDGEAGRRRGKWQTTGSEHAPLPVQVRRRTDYLYLI